MKRFENKNSDRGQDRGGDFGERGGERRSFQKRKGCRFCTEPGFMIDYKDKATLSSFITERAKIVPRRISGLCAAHQRELGVAIKRSRHLAYLLYTSVQN
ncbi:MAG: 30S ribosomal protein S18 [Deltaproteobacteria bacterium]|nr:30S ribosomal protein S18 [Deltaproteobacteria bacterium]